MTVNQPDRLLRRQRRHFSAHHMLVRTARIALDRARESEVGSLYELLTAMVFTAFAIEAVTNSVGSVMVEEWEDFEALRPMSKVRFVCERLGVPFNRNEAPWNQAAKLFKFRNSVAHAKPELIFTSKRVLANHEPMNDSAPESKIEQELTLSSAETAFAAAERIVRLLTDKIPVDMALGLAVDGWTGSLTADDGGSGSAPTRTARPRRS